MGISPDPAIPGVQSASARTAPFAIDQPDKAWMVERGSVDVFLVEARPGQPPGARHHVTRVEQGEALFGIQPPALFPALVLAVATPESRVSEMRSPLLQQVSGQEHERAVQLVETWIGGLSESIATNAPPKSFDFIEAATALQLTEAVALVPRKGVAWIDVREGSAHFAAGAFRARLVPGTLFPVSAHCWIEATENAALSAVRTDERPGDALWDGLQRFHAAVLEGLLEKLRTSGEKEAARSRRRRQSEQLDLDYAMRLLAAPLQQEEDQVPLLQTADDLYYVACAALGKTLGIEFKSGADKTRAGADPVNSIARATGVRVRTVALRGPWWRQDAGALLGRREGDRAPVALLPDARKGYQMFDPVSRTRTAVTRKIAASLEPFAWYFYRPFPEKQLRSADLLLFGLKGCGADLARVVLMSCAAALLGLITPIVTGILFDTVIPGANRTQVGQIVALLLVATVCISLFELTKDFALLRLEGKMDSSVQAAVWDRLLSLPVPFFRSYTSGDLAMRGLSISTMRQVLTGSALSSILSGVFSVVSFGLLFYYSAQLAVLAVVVTLVAVMFTAGIGWLQIRKQREMIHVSGMLSGLLLQLLNGIAKLRVSGAENRAFAAWARRFARQKQLSMEARTLNMALGVFNSVFPVLSAMLLFYAMATITAQRAGGRLTTGEFLAFNAAFVQFQAAALGLSSAFLALLGVVPLYERAKPILHTLPEVTRTKAHPGELSGNIEVRHVNFRYQADTPLVLRNVSIAIPAGRFIAFVGPSGSGKSTLLRLLLGFEVPESGAVYFDNQDLTGLDIQAVRQQIGVVLQSGRLSAGSIYQNIIGSAPLTMEDAMHAVRMAGMESDIRAMPMGLHTIVGEGGGGLSGGQRQRLMIARAIVKKPRIVFFDEATSALDNETQTIVGRSLESLKATRVVIAHRLSTIVNADYIYVMTKGVLVQEGRYEDLICVEGPFADLARRQML